MAGTQTQDGCQILKFSYNVSNLAVSQCMNYHIECKGGEGRSSSDCKDLQGELENDLWMGTHKVLEPKIRVSFTFRDGVVDGLARALGRPIQPAGSWLERNPVGAWVCRSCTTQ